MYDSDESSIDRMSLEAVRVIPPAHLDEQFRVVRTTPTARETFVWEAGKGVALDLAGGGAGDIAGPGDPAYPEPEPGLDPGAAVGGDFPPEFPPFPGEASSDAGLGPAGEPAGWDPAWGSPPSWLDIFVGSLVDGTALPRGFDPPPAGSPFQIESAAITSGWKSGDSFTVGWEVSGDESEIGAYVVELLPVRPDQDPPLIGPALAGGTVPRGSHRLSGLVPPAVGDSYLYLMPKVTATAADPAGPDHTHTGPARPLFSAGTNSAGQLQLINVFWYTRPPLVSALLAAVSFGGEPPGGGRAVWTSGRVPAHNDILMDNPHPGLHIAVRPEIGDGLIIVRLRRPGLVGRHRVLAHVGFLGGGPAGNAVEVELRCRLMPPGGGPPAVTYAPVSVNMVTPAGGPPAAMKLIEQLIDTPAAGPGPYRLEVFFIVKGGAVDPAHPPGLFAVRLVPTP